jgi:SAM-dependent methyltransferase
VARQIGYGADELAALPQGANMGLSCGNPAALAALQPGEVVLDLGAGGGFDVFIAGRKVGPAGRAIGVDMTPEMIALARQNAVKFALTTGLGNVEFRQGQIEHLPVEDGAVDVAISNCVINLSPDKPLVFREVYRVLRPGGRMIVSDIVLNRPMPPELNDDAKLFAACLAGALMREDYLQAIRAVGFPRVEVLSDNAYVRHQAGDDPITGGAAEVLAAIAASIIVLAVK